jgi:hypothetical protein
MKYIADDGIRAGGGRLRFRSPSAAAPASNLMVWERCQTTSPTRIQRNQSEPKSMTESGMASSILMATTTVRQ